MAKFRRGQCNVQCKAMKASKGKKCNRKAMLRAVKSLGVSGAVAKHCR